MTIIQCQVRVRVQSEIVRTLKGWADAVNMAAGTVRVHWDGDEESVWEPACDIELIEETE